jgi:hypothetical protein
VYQLYKIDIKTNFYYKGIIYLTIKQLCNKLKQNPNIISLDNLYLTLANNERFPFVIKLIFKRMENEPRRTIEQELSCQAFVIEKTDIKNIVDIIYDENDEKLNDENVLEYFEKIINLCDKLKLEPTDINLNILYDTLINNKHFPYVIKLIIKKVKSSFNTTDFPTLPSCFTMR